MSAIPVEVRAPRIGHVIGVRVCTLQFGTATISQALGARDALAITEEIVDAVDFAQGRLAQFLASRDVTVAQLEEDRAMRAVAIEHGLLIAAVEP